MYPYDVLDPTQIATYPLGPSLLTNPQLPQDDLVYRGTPPGMKGMVPIPNYVPGSRPPLTLLAQMAGDGQGGPPMPSTATTIDPSAPVREALDRQQAGDQHQEQIANPKPAGPSFVQRVMAGLFHVPSAYQGLLSPEDIGQARGQTLMQIGAGLMGAGLRPGEHASFGGQLANALGTLGPTWNQNITGALAQQSQGIDVGNTLEQNIAARQIAGMYPQISEDPEVAQRQYLDMAHAYTAARLPALAQNAIGMANSIKERQASLAGATAPPSWYKDWLAKNPEPTDPAAHVAWERQQARDLASAGYPGSARESRMMGENEINQILAQQREAGVNTRYYTGQNFREGTAFTSRADIKPLLDQSTKYSQTYAILDQAVQGNPAAYKSMAGNLAQTLDQKGQLRTTLFQIFSQFDPSARGRFETWYEKWKSGGYPQYQLQDVKQMLDAARQKAEKKYNDAAADYKKTYKNAYIPPIDFGQNPTPATSTPTGPSPTPAATDYHQYLPPPR
jgi:hypothetical protein